MRSQAESLAGFRVENRSRLFPANLVARVRDGLRVPLLIVLCGKPVQHISGLLIAARAVDQRSELVDSAVLEKADGFGTHGGSLAGGLSRPDLLVTEPVLAMLERIGGQVELVRRPLPKRAEVGLVAGDVERWQGLR